MNRTKIEWTEKTWNPVTGCTPCSPGCANCYARRMASRLRGRCGYPADDPFRVTFHFDRIAEPHRMRKPARIFVCSMGDLFHEGVCFDVIQRIWVEMQDPRCHRHTFHVLTKRPERLLDYVRWNETRPQANSFSVEFTRPHIWLGVTVCNQAEADAKIPVLLEIPAAVRFVSIEPMLEQMDLNEYLDPSGYVSCGGIPECRCAGCVRLRNWPMDERGIVRPDWIIAGAETGPGARPAKLDWFRKLRDQANAAGVPFFLKQVNARRERVLDGRTWDERPGGKRLVVSDPA